MRPELPTNEIEPAQDALDLALCAAEGEIRSWGLDVLATTPLYPDARGPTLHLVWRPVKDGPKDLWRLFIGRTLLLQAPLRQKIDAATVLARGEMMVALVRATRDTTRQIEEATNRLNAWLEALKRGAV